MASASKFMKRLSLVAAFALGLLGDAGAQSLKQQIVGTWDFVVAEITGADGKKSFPFGETPKGVLVFTPEGRFAQIHIASDLPKIALGNRLTGTADEYAAINRRSLSVFGSYAVDEEKKTVTFQDHFEHVPELGRRSADAHHRQADRGRVRQHQP